VLDAEQAIKIARDLAWQIDQAYSGKGQA
jgi:hypothetical protein